MKCYVVDAFADHLFEGNPAAVCVLDTWLSDELMQLIAVENNLSETAFAVKNAGSYGLRWFTPGGEIDLCGHATLATAYVLMRFYEPNAGEISFQTKSGGLNVKRSGDRFEMDFPAYVLSSVPVTEAMTAALGVRPLEAWMGRGFVFWPMSVRSAMRRRTRNSSSGAMVCSLTSPRAAVSMTVSAGHLRRNSMLPKIRYVAPVTVILCRCGPISSARRI
mgnify:CR=1 FL=1